MKKLGLALVALAAAFPLYANRGFETKQVLSKVYTIDRKYRSMEGPASVQRIYLGDPSKPELIWIVGVKTEMVGEDGKTPQLPELMCHVNVDLEPILHSTLMGVKRVSATRLITLSQGMLDAELPHGFGFPIASNEPLTLFTQVLNHNIEHPNIKVRHRVTFAYVRQRDLTEPMKPLFNVGASGMVLLQDPVALPVSMSTDAMGAHGTSCLIGTRASNAAGMAADYTDPHGRHFTGHWNVPPGRQTNHSDISWFMSLPYDTVLHYAAVHLHPFAESLSVRDVTTNQTILTSKATNPAGRVGLMHVDTFSSPEGIPLHKDHEYEIVSVYNNTTKETHDSMASVFLGLSDPELVPPTPLQLTARATDLIRIPPTETAIVRTTSGDFTLLLDPANAPQSVRQFFRLASAGMYDHARLNTSGPSLVAWPPAQKAAQTLLFPLPIESTARHTPGTLSICPADPSFAMVVTGAAERDGKCSVFGRIGPGAATLAKIINERSAPEIRKIEFYETTGDALKALNQPPTPPPGSASRSPYSR